MTERATAILRALADLAPTGEGTGSAGRTIPLEWFRWLPLQSVRLLVPPIDYVDQHTVPMSVPIDRRFGERLAAVDQLRPEQRSLRVGWLFAAGRTPDGSRVFHPLVTMKVRVERGMTWASLEAVGDAEITDLVADPATRAELEGGIEFGGGGLDDTTQIALEPGLLARFTHLHGFAARVAEAAGLPTRRLVPAGGDPEDVMAREGLAVVAGVGVYAVHETGGINRAATLRQWAESLGPTWTSFHSLYLGAPDEPRPSDERTVRTPAVLTPVQCKAVLASRTQPVTVVSGAPGTGKSHTITAIASDAIGRNESVLVAAKSEATVDALLELLERAPGPQPVVFGSSERRRALAARLASGQQAPPLDHELATILVEVQQAESARDRARASIEARLRAEQLCGDGFDAAEEVADLCPALRPATAEERAKVDDLLAQLAARPRGWRARRRRRALNALTGAAPDTAVADIRAAVETLRSLEDAASLARRGGLELASEWDRLLRLDDRARFEAGRWLEAQSRSSARINRRTMPVVAALATALRSGRSARREQLARLEADRLTAALPLWVGTLADIDDLLPPRAAMFDVVILDEASSIDQPLAATALLRAKRAVVVGDPHQLRHVSFLGDARTRGVLDTHGLRDAAIAATLDVRRNSAFDVAAGVAPTHALNEHFRSNPHLVDFVARRLYRGEVHVATRSPRTEHVDCVNVVRVPGHRDKAGAVQAELDAVVAELQKLSRTGARSVGVVTPFRAQADALERAVLAAFTADELVAMDLRVGTVHGMQGIERDVVVASVGIGPDDAASWRFAEDPHLFAVFATRARRHFVIIHSADPPAGGLMAEYLAQADQPPGPPKPVRPVDEWAAAIAAHLESAGVPVRTAYPTGRHVLDVCVGDRRRAASIDCAVHPEGPAAHVERALALRRAGWEVVDAFGSKWGGRRAELAVELVRLLGPF